VKLPAEFVRNGFLFYVAFQFPNDHTGVLHELTHFFSLLPLEVVVDILVRTLSLYSPLQLMTISLVTQDDELFPMRVSPSWPCFELAVQLHRMKFVHSNFSEAQDRFLVHVPLRANGDASSAVQPLSSIPHMLYMGWHVNFCIKMRQLGTPSKSVDLSYAEPFAYKMSSDQLRELNGRTLAEAGVSDGDLIDLRYDSCSAEFFCRVFV
jgi:hypothetical protein